MRRLALTLCLWLLAATASAVSLAPVVAPRIGVMTMEPGEEFWERFGHNAIVVVDPATQAATSYNYGYFDMSEPDFVGNFVRGRMRYQLVAIPFEEDVENYRLGGRGVTLQWLDLDPAQAESLAAALALNARPENARYTYDYFESNCSTRVRDRLDEALGGMLKRHLSGRSEGNTYRNEAVRLAWPAPWMAYGFHVGLSGAADAPLSRWQEAFIPMRLRDSLRELKRADGRPLVLQEAVLVPHRLSLPPSELPRWRVAALFVGMALAVSAMWLGRRRPRTLAAIALPFWTLCTLMGATMLFLWLGSQHRYAWGNENLLLLSPLCLLLLPGGWAIARGRAPSKRFASWLWLVAGCAALAGFLKFLPFRPQENVEWVLLFLPMHLALARGLDPKPKT